MAPVDPALSTAFLTQALAALHPRLRTWRGEAALRGERRAFLQGALARCEDRAFAARFARSCPVPGAEPSEYLHRLLALDDTRVLLGGIRFRGGALDHPFVDVLATSWDVEAAGGYAAVVAAVNAEWSRFAPRAVRILRATPGLEEPALAVEVDQLVVAGRVDELVRRAPPQHTGRVALRPLEVEPALALVRSAYDALFARHPALGAKLHAATREELVACRERGRLFAIAVDGAARAVGVLAVEARAEHGVDGWVVVEEIIVGSHRGQRLASAAQRRLAEALVAEDPRGVLFGTIAGSNQASLRTAARVGREVIAAYLFVRARDQERPAPGFATDVAVCQDASGAPCGGGADAGRDATIPDNDTEEDLRKTLIEDPRVSLVPGAASPPDEAALLAALSLPAAGGRLELKETLGQGGMGVVHLATQSSMGRAVAVKRLHPEAASERARLKLLREAWVTGTLEHPNVVPVYDVSIDGEGQPAIVLKLIDGVRWSALMHDPAAVARRSTGHDPLEWNLRVLMQVCNAVHFAHSRGILHRDIKPDNVMIGGFGEVYVLDWGIALSLRPDPLGRLPSVEEARGIAGTPAYMAPEMLDEDPRTLTSACDIYLLGAVLYEILAGEPPQRGENLAAILHGILHRSPPLPDAAPALRAICRRAMHRDPARRYASAEEMRAACDHFLTQRGSMRLAETAEQQLASIRAQLAGGGTLNEEEHGRLYLSYGACRFGFQAALEAWPGNAQARAALQEACEELCRYELRQRDSKAAARFVAEMEQVPPALERALRSLQEEEAREARRLAQLHRQHYELDPEVGWRARTAIVLTMGSVWAIGPAASEWFGWTTIEQVGENVLAYSLVFAAMVLALGLLARRTVLSTTLNRRVFLTLLFVPLAQVVLHLGTRLGGLAPFDSMRLHFFLWMSTGTLAAIHVERGLWPSAVGYLLGFFGAMAWPDQVIKLMSLANLGFFLNLLALTYRDKAPRRPGA